MIVGHVATEQSHETDRRMGDADPKAHSLGIAAEAIVARQGNDAAPSGTQGHSGH